MSTLTALLLILFGFALAVSMLLWAAVRPKPPAQSRHSGTATPAPQKPSVQPPTPRAYPAARPAVRLRPHTNAPPPARKPREEESDAFKRFLQSDD